MNDLIALRAVRADVIKMPDGSIETVWELERKEKAELLLF